MIKLYGDGIHDDTRGIQTMLDKRGYVFIPDGTYLITKPLIIHDNTHLHASAFAHFCLGDYANCSLLDNDGLYSRSTNTNITLEGGIWDGNNMKQERQIVPDENVPCSDEEYILNRLAVFMIRFVHTKNLVIKNITFKDPTTFGIHIADVEYFRIENVTLDYNLKKPNMDGVHIQGPARFGKIHGVYGDAHDDHVALCANGTTRSEITRGPIEEIEIRGIYCNNGYTGVRLLSSGDPVRNISISEIHGKFRFYAVSFTHHYPIREDRPILIENVHLSNIYTSKAAYETAEPHHKESVRTGALIWVESGVTCRNIQVDSVYRNEICPQTVAPTFRISNGVELENFRIGNYFENHNMAEYQTIENSSDSEVLFGV